MKPSIDKGAARGIRLYASVLALLRTPMTANEVSAAMPMHPVATRQLMRLLHGRRLIRVAAWTRSRAIGPFHATYHYAPGPDAPYPGPTGARSCVPTGSLGTRSVFLAFVSLMRFLEQPMSQRDLVQETGLTRCCLQPAIKHMRNLGLVRIAAWELPTGCGALAPLYQLGEGRNASRPPKAKRSVCNRRTAQAKRDRAMTLELVHLTAAPIHQPMPLAGCLT